MCGFREGYIWKNFKMSNERSVLTLICVISGKSCQIARPFTIYKMPDFMEGCTLKFFSSIKFQMADYWPLFTLICSIFCKMCQTITIIQMCGLRDGHALKKISSIKCTIADLQASLSLICLIFGKPCGIARPLL